MSYEKLYQGITYLGWRLVCLIVDEHYLSLINWWFSKFCNLDDLEHIKSFWNIFLSNSSSWTTAITDFPWQSASLHIALSATKLDWERPGVSARLVNLGRDMHKTDPCK